MNPLDPSLFTMTAPCLPCCDQPVECVCAMLIPPQSGPYSSYTDAIDAIADFTSGCVGFYEPTGDTGNTFTADFDGTTLSMDATSEVSGAPANIVIHEWASISLLAGSTVSIDYVITTDGTGIQAEAEILTCDGTSVDTDSSSSSTGTLTVTVADDGEYILHLGLQAGAGTNDATALGIETTSTCDDTFWVKPVIALWDDSGTTRQLEACPKLYLPYQTEISGTWYADETAAQDVLDDPLTVADCIGFFFPTVDWTSASAADSGTAVTLSASFSPDQGDMAGIVSINAEAGETITFTASGFADLNVIIYDTEFNIVESAVGSSPQTSASLPYTGRYIIDYQLSNGTVPSGAIVITSSGSLSANPIQALYDVGLGCPARLDC